MRSRLQPSRLHSLLLLGAIEFGLLPLRVAARLLGWLLLAVAAIGVPAWLVQLIISLLSGGGGGGPLPAWAMVLLLALAIPVGVLALRVADAAAPPRGAKSPRNATGATGGDDDEADEDGAGFADRAGHDSAEKTYTRDPISDAYDTLDLDRAATPADIKTAYRRLARTYHPDRNPGFAQEAAERFAEINTAYEVLTREVVTKPRHGRNPGVACR